MGAVEFAGEQIGMVADALPGLYIFAAPLENGVGGVPQFLGDDGRDDFSGFVLEHHPFLRGEEFLLLGEHIDDLDLVAHIVAFVLGVGNHAGHGGVGQPLAVVVAVALFPEAIFNLLHAVAVAGVEPEQLPDHGSFGFVNDQPPVLLLVAENPAVAQHHPGFDGLLVAELHPGGELAQFVLGDGGHDGQPQLGIFVQGVDVVVLEEHPHPMAQKLPGKLDGVQSISGKAGDFLGDDQIEFVQGGVFDHAVEVFPLLGGNTGKTLVDVPGDKGPAAVALNQVLIVGNLVSQGVELFVGLGRNPGVKGHPHGNVIDGFGAQLLADGVDVHMSALLLFVVSCLVLLYLKLRKKQLTLHDNCRSVSKKSYSICRPWRQIKSKKFSAGTGAWQKTLLRLQVWNLSPIGGEIMRAADCKTCRKAPKGGFRQSD